MILVIASLLFFVSDPAPTEIYTLSLHDALPISGGRVRAPERASNRRAALLVAHSFAPGARSGSEGMGNERSEEHTSELQSRRDLVCRLLLEKKKKKTLHLQIYMQSTLLHDIQ